MSKMQNRILELVYDKLMDNYFKDQDNFELERVTDQEIDFNAGTISFNYEIGGTKYDIKIKLAD